MSGNSLDQGIRANEAPLPDVQKTPADAKSSDAMLFAPARGSATPTSGAIRTHAEVVAATENRVRSFIDSGQAEFSTSASAEDRYNAFMFSDTIRYNFETGTVQVLAETHLGVPGWQNLGDVSPELARGVTLDINVLINERVFGPLPGPVTTPGSASVQQSDEGGTTSVAIGAQTPQGVGVDSQDGNTATDGGLIQVGQPTVNEQNQTIDTSSLDANGNEVFISSNPATGVSTVIDPQTGDVLAHIHVDPGNGAQTVMTPDGEPIFHPSGLPANSGYLNTQTSSTAYELGGLPVSAVRVTTEDGTVIYSSLITSDGSAAVPTAPDETVLDPFTMAVLGPDGTIMYVNAPPPYGPYLPGPEGPYLPPVAGTGQTQNAQEGSDSDGTPPVNLTSDAAYENQQVDLPVDYSTDAAWEEVNQQTDSQTVETTQTQTGGSGGSSGTGGSNGTSGGSGGSAGSMGTGVSPTGSDVTGTPF